MSVLVALRGTLFSIFDLRICTEIFLRLTLNYLLFLFVFLFFGNVSCASVLYK